MMKISVRFNVIWGLCCLVFTSQLAAQSIKGQRIGLYISSRQFEVDQAFNIKVGQFLQQGDEDRSYVGDLNRELIIQFGEMWCNQLQALSQADSIYFLNGVPSMGRALQQSLNMRTQSLEQPSEVLKTLDEIWVLSTFHIRSRTHKSVYIRSNRVYTERIPVENLRLEMWAFKPQDPSYFRQEIVCFDRLNHKISSREFDFFTAKSKFGLYLSNAMTQWWNQWATDATSLCE